MSGWDDFDEVKLPPAGEIDLTDKLFVEAFNTASGKKLLAYWKRQYLDQPVCAPGSSADFGFHREGQNSIVREALSRMQRAMTPKGDMQPAMTPKGDMQPAMTPKGDMQRAMTPKGDMQRAMTPKGDK
jgi:hypothetical protein